MDQSEVPEAILDAPEAEGLSASGKVYLFQTPAPLVLQWLVVVFGIYLTAGSFVPCGEDVCKASVPLQQLPALPMEFPFLFQTLAMPRKAEAAGYN